MRGSLEEHTVRGSVEEQTVRGSVEDEEGRDTAQCPVGIVQVTVIFLSNSRLILV